MVPQVAHRPHVPGLFTSATLLSSAAGAARRPCRRSASAPAARGCPHPDSGRPPAAAPAPGFTAGERLGLHQIGDRALRRSADHSDGRARRRAATGGRCRRRPARPLPRHSARPAAARKGTSERTDPTHRPGIGPRISGCPVVLWVRARWGLIAQFPAPLKDKGRAPAGPGRALVDPLRAMLDPAQADLRREGCQACRVSCVGQGFCGHSVEGVAGVGVGFQEELDAGLGDGAAPGE